MCWADPHASRDPAEKRLSSFDAACLPRELLRMLPILTTTLTTSSGSCPPVLLSPHLPSTRFVRQSGFWCFNHLLAVLPVHSLSHLAGTRRLFFTGRRTMLSSAIYCKRRPLCVTSSNQVHRLLSAFGLAAVDLSPACRHTVLFRARAARRGRLVASAHSVRVSTETLSRSSLASPSLHAPCHHTGMRRLLDVSNPR